MSSVSSSVSHSTRAKTGATAGPTMRVPALGTGQPAAGASLMGLLASKRLAKQFANRIAARRAVGSESTTLVKAPSIEPTYRMEPSTRFQSAQVQSTVRHLVDRRMKGFQYSAKVAAMMTKILTSEIKDAVKDMAFERYKIVCVVSIGEKRGQDLRITSRCSWDASLDTSATYTWSDTKSYCCATVYGIYHE